jgi:hypothetical protein
MMPCPTCKREPFEAERPESLMVTAVLMAFGMLVGFVIGRC